MLLGREVDENNVLANDIIGPRASGIAFEGKNDGNIVTRNKVVCAQGAECLVVDAYPQAYETNRVKGNTTFQPTQPYILGEVCD